MSFEASTGGSLVGKVALVTGAGGGIGQAIVREFRREGAAVLALDCTLDGLDIFADDVGVVPCVADITSAAGVAKAFAMIDEKFGRIDVLANNAGIGGPRTLRLHELPLEDFDAVMSVNLRAVLAMSQAALARMVANGGGAIVITASASAFHAVPRVGSYSISKAAVAMLTRQIAREYASDGVRCNAVAPGLTKTRLLEGLPLEHLAEIEATIPGGRMAEPREIAEVIAYLASDRASYVNGAVLQVDAGAAA